ncbi:MAG: PQQ-binding-like beta-propeller repeat protein [Candidatus Hydrogenedentes bacterium]|nr:PQQ-binding-like beta-propeller repeat protein [Candidatus Hydrogenedentota bacterium]
MSRNSIWMAAGLLLSGVAVLPAAAQDPGTEDIRLVSELPNGEWHLPAGDYANTRYSPLTAINTDNVKDLKMAWTVSTGVPRGHERQPLVVNGILYIVTPFPNNLIAIDLTNPGGKFFFKYAPYPDPRSVGVACCDVVNRGASYADGKIFYACLDTTVVAVDAATGEEIWRNKVGNPDEGETITNAALVVKDKVIVGNSGGELGVRGKIVALDTGSGEIQWTAYSTGPDEEVLIGDDFKPFFEKDQGADLGVKTWPQDQWKLGGGTVNKLLERYGVPLIQTRARHTQRGTTP